MLSLVPAVLIAAAGAAIQPVPPRAPLADAQKRAADAYVKECYAWADQLTKLGEGMGSMWVDVLDGKKPSSALRAELKRTIGLMDDRVAALKAKSVPAFPEIAAFKAAFLDYLVWEKKMYVDWISDAARVADDRTLKRAEKEQEATRSLRAQESEENAWKAKIQDAMKAVYTALNRK